MIHPISIAVHRGPLRGRGCRAVQGLLGELNYAAADCARSQIRRASGSLTAYPRHWDVLPEGVTTEPFRVARVVGNSNALVDYLRAQDSTVYYWSGASLLFDLYGNARHARCSSTIGADELTSLLASR